MLIGLVSRGYCSVKDRAHKLFLLLRWSTISPCLCELSSLEAAPGWLGLSTSLGHPWVGTGLSVGNPRVIQPTDLCFSIARVSADLGNLSGDAGTRHKYLPHLSILWLNLTIVNSQLPGSWKYHIWAGILQNLNPQHAWPLAHLGSSAEQPESTSITHFPLSPSWLEDSGTRCAEPNYSVRLCTQQRKAFISS